MARHGLTVKEVAKLVGVTVRALHHYDSIGVLKPSTRTSAGYRIYTDEDIARLRAILELRQSGVRLAEARVLNSVDATDSHLLLAKEHKVLHTQMDAIAQRLHAIEAALSVFELQQRMQAEAPKSPPNSLSSARRDRLRHLFALLDVNRDGYLEGRDFRLIADRLCASSAQVPSSFGRTFLLAHLQAQWNLFRVDASPTLSESEWLSAHSRVLGSPSFALLIGSFSDALFNVVVGKQEDAMRYEHLVRLHSAYGVQRDDSDVLWASANRDTPLGTPQKSISRGALKALLLELYFSDAPDATGSLLFGRALTSAQCDPNGSSNGIRFS